MHFLSVQIYFIMLVYHLIQHFSTVMCEKKNNIFLEVRIKMFYNYKNNTSDKKRRKNSYNIAAFTLAGVMAMSSLALTGCGKAPITLNAKTFILEQGNSMPTEASVYVKGKSEDVAKTVLNAEGVDYNTVGTYTAELVHPDKTLRIEVKVVDTTAPAVELYADEFSVAPGQMLSITDVVKSMSDNSSVTIGFADDITKADADKILSQSVVYPEAGAYSSEICAKDAYGNMTVLPIVIMVVNDSEPPVLNGVNKTVYATVGNAVDILANVTATDNIDGDITSRVTDDISAVDFNTVGTYTAVISVKDGSGNETREEVSVVVQDPSASLNSGSTVTVGTDFGSYSSEYVPFGFGSEVDENNRPTGLQWYINRYGKYTADFIQPESNYIYLTMDEGYEYGLTEGILDTLKEKNVKAVFFITLPYAKQNPELVQRMIDEGHVVGNHSVTHPSAGLSTLSVEQQINEVKEVNDYVLEHFGYQMYLFRFPTGAFSEQSLAIVQSQGYRSVFWSFAYKDWVVDEQPDVASSLANALNKVHGGAIYLLHAESTTNASMLADFIDGCRAKGFEFGYYSKVD